MRIFYVLLVVTFVSISETVYSETCPQTFNNSAFSHVILFPQKDEVECVYPGAQQKYSFGHYSPTSGPWTFDSGFDVYWCGTDKGGSADNCVFNLLS